MVEVDKFLNMVRAASGSTAGARRAYLANVRI